jgi:ribA/ribD-fused uncharacterized protein
VPVLKVINEITQFKDEYAWLSNFEPVIIHSSGLTFQSVEIAYQASKTNNYNEWKKFAALGAMDSGKSKYMGRRVKLIKDWEIKKLLFMKRFLTQKFIYDKFRRKLLETGFSELIEGNYWHDNYWGDCYCQKCKRKLGQNMLGKLIMEIRDNI